ncbi:MAG TPA: NTP transferase domain-containing protein [Dehalococcoidia bacterium]|nr:NTP transferase domain-containing protein [Dehalococcoidia bacterium]
MKAVILAAGEGKRMHPLTYTRPKVMLPIANRPIMEHLLIELKGAGIKDFIFVVGYHGETIRQHFDSGDKWGINIEYVTQMKQFGTAHALKLIQRFVDDRFILANGDVLVRAADIRKVLSKDTITISLIEDKDTTDVGVVELSGDKILGIHEKVIDPPSSLVNAGVYLMTAEIFSAIDKTKESPRGEYELTDSLQILLSEGKTISGVEIDHWLNVSYPWDLLAANESLMESIEAQTLGTIEENVVIKGTVSIGKGTLVRANSYISGPVIIGEECDIGPNCFIRSSTAIGDNCHIGSAVEVKNSIIMQNSKIPHHNYVGDSIIGEGCNFGAGTKIANLRLDKKEISIANINTKRRKLGAIVGDGVQTGINANINVGSLIGDHTYIGPGTTASGVVLPGSKIF